MKRATRLTLTADDLTALNRPDLEETLRRRIAKAQQRLRDGNAPTIFPGQRTIDGKETP